MQTRQYNVYSYDELSEEQKEKVIERYWTINVDFNDWYESTLEYWQEKLSVIGFEESKIYFSGFSSQGGGACFDAKCNEEKLINHLIYCDSPKNPSFTPRQYSRLLALADSGLFDLSIHTSDHHYSHENCRAISLDDDTAGGFYRDGKMHYSMPQLELQKLSECIEELRHDLCQTIYYDLRADYEALTSREAIEGAIAANEYMFTADGKID